MHPKRDGQETRDLVDLSISSRAQAFLGTRPCLIRSWYIRESDKAVNSAVCRNEVAYHCHTTPLSAVRAERKDR